MEKETMWAIINKKTKEFIYWRNDENYGMIVLKTKKRAKDWKDIGEKIVRIEIKITD